MLCSDFSTYLYAQQKKKLPVKKDEVNVSVMPIYVYPQEREFKAFAGLDLPNQLHVTGTVPKVYDFKQSYTEGVNIVKIEGPGAIGGTPGGEEGKVDSVWYWHYKPFDSDTGKTFTVRYVAGATRHGGKADTMIGSFKVHVYPLIPESAPIYDPKDEHNYPTAYTGVPFKVNGKYKNLDGDYKIDFHICDTMMVCEARSFYGPYAQFTSKLAKDEGKDIEITISFRSYQSNMWTVMRHDHATIKPAPFGVVTLERIDPSKELHAQAYYGIEGYSIPATSEVLDVESGGFFEPKAILIPKPEQMQSQPLHEEAIPPSAEYILKPTDRYKQLGSKELPIQILFKDPVTGKQVTRSVTLLPPGEASR
jgi:hypothetical protein